MSEPVIQIDNLSKRYVISHQANARDGLRHQIEDAVRNPFRWLAAKKRAWASAHEDFWAVKDVSFDVHAGDSIAVVGRNGAGKSTLLKLLSRITEPSSGRVTLTGRVASLLEVGTGFHQELTGRENIYLNGAILGMSKVEIKRKFDEIVAFSEIEKFLDTPVKRYSSGMYVRLAFAVAAHLEPEILIVDEVLAVGDSEFQKKCLGKMGEVAQGGRTILFVSHNMGAVRRLCKKAVMLESGKLVTVGQTEDVLSRYLKSADSGGGERVWPEGPYRKRDPRVWLQALRIRNADGLVTDRIDISRPMTVDVEYELKEEMPLFRVALKFETSDGTLAFLTADSGDPGYDQKPRTPGKYVCRCFVPGKLLNEGRYSLTLTGDVPFQKMLFVEEAVASFVVEQTDGASARYNERWPGAVCPVLKWRTEETGEPGKPNQPSWRTDEPSVSALVHE